MWPILWPILCANLYLFETRKCVSNTQFTIDFSSFGVYSVCIRIDHE